MNELNSCLALERPRRPWVPPADLQRAALNSATASPGGAGASESRTASAASGVYYVFDVVSIDRRGHLQPKGTPTPPTRRSSPRWSRRFGGRMFSLKPVRVLRSSAERRGDT